MGHCVMAKAIDTSRSKCRVCGKPYQPGDTLYSLSSEIVDEGDTRFLLAFEHATCHVPLDQAIADLRNRLAGIQRKLR